ncbi:MAG: D-alanine--D-alanine ligase [Gammaproteobacteria bacterium]|nr:D-alanine--D-alanine ligase [Gammaproteobacteria bacterium]
MKPSINKNLRIAVISGGPSREAEVSRSSAKGVTEALRENYVQVENLELDAGLLTQLHGNRFDVVFPVLHGAPGEDGTFQGFLEILGLPYVGSDVHASSSAMNKYLAKLLFKNKGLPVARDLVVTRHADPATEVQRISKALGHYVVIKPLSQGSGLGVQFVDNQNQMHDSLCAAMALGDHLLVEERIDGREITVGVIETDDGTSAFDVIEIVTPEGAWYDYEHRYTEGLSEHLLPASLTEQQTRRLKQIAIDAHQALGCRDLSRADFVVANNDSECLLEVNTLPGMTPTSLYPDGARAFGLDFPALVSHLVERAYRRSINHGS